MNNFFRTLIAGYGAKKLGGGCFSTILIFFLIYWALGTCNKPAAPVRQGTGMHAPATAAPQAVAVKY
jgi:hypothetical protein